MSSDTIVQALFLISAVIAAGLLINAIFPLIYTTSGTFGLIASTKESEIRTEIRIVNWYATDSSMQIWVKNVGMSRFSQEEIGRSSIFAGYPDSFDLISPEQVSFQIEGSPERWDPGETLSISISGLSIPNDPVYFMIVLPIGKKETKIWDKSEIL